MGCEGDDEAIIPEPIDAINAADGAFGGSDEWRKTADDKVTTMPSDPSRRAPGKLRVIAGELRGRRIKTPRGDLVRPTSDRVREALFDILGARIAGSVFLDAYAGTGAVGIEALSRGAANVAFVEHHPQAVALLRANLESCGAATERVRIVERDLARAMPILEELGRPFDFLFVDPPYTGGELDRALRLLSRSPLVGGHSTIIAEHEARLPAPHQEPLILTRTAAYGRTALSFLSRAR